MKFLGYVLFRILILLFAVMPFSCLYVLSFFLYVLLFYVFKYRKTVVITNLKNSFPTYSDAQIRQITKKYYHFLSQLILETAKSYTMTKKQLLKRVRFENVELIDNLYQQKKSIILAMAHFGNWEWVSVAGAYALQHKVVGLYKPLKNKYFDAFIKKVRFKSVAYLVPIHDTFSNFKALRSELCVYGFLADQSPSNVKNAIWVDFLNQDTPCIHGTEKYAKIFDYPVVFARVNRLKRGYYRLRFEMLEEQPKKTEEGYITKKYIHALEQLIIEQPEVWLWSHRRWKRKRSDLMKVKNE